MDDERRRRRKDFWDDLFDDDEFEDIFEQMKKMMEDMLRDPSRFAEKPMVYGYTMRIGPDGKPMINSFGNQSLGRGESAREPLTDVMEKDDEITIVMEVPGVDKDDIDVEVSERAVRVSANGAQNYQKEVQLPSSVDTTSTKATYKNGVLSVTVKKKEKGKKVRVE
jgi:HSP20 family protein